MKFITSIVRNINFLLFFAILTTLIGTTIFAAERFLLVYSFANIDLKDINFSDLQKLFGVGFRLDIHIGIQITCALSIICLVLSLFKQNRIAGNIASICFSVFIVISIFASVINFYYYRTYEKVIDVFFYNFFNEDINALAITVYKDYPIILIFIGLILSALIVYSVIKKLIKVIAKVFEKTNVYVSLAMLVILLFFVGVFYNGGFTTTKIRAKAVTFNDISPVKVINQARSNPISLFHMYFKEYREARQINISNPSEQEYTAILNKFSLPRENIKIRSFYSVTDKNEYLENNKPNVVVVFAESLSYQMSTFDSDSFDLLSSLRLNLQEDHHFKYFISEGGATLKSVVRFLFRVPFYLLPYHTDFSKLHYRTFAFEPYLKQGYELAYISGSPCSWGNLSTILKNHGVTKFACADSILEKYPEAPNLYWGVADEYLYKYAEDLLNEASKNNKPLAIFMLTTTNHTPHALPSNYVGLDTDKFPQKILSEHSRYPHDEVIKHYGTYRYSAEMLGNFINKVKNSDVLKNNTVIAFTGDHNARIGNSDPNFDQTIVKGVLTSFYIPEVLKQSQNFIYKKDKVGSHKDIMPTLIEHTLSNQEYVKLGCDLFSDKECPYSFGFNEEVLIENNKSDTSYTNEKAKADYQNYTELLQFIFSYQVYNNSYGDK